MKENTTPQIDFDPMYELISVESMLIALQCMGDVSSDVYRESPEIFDMDKDILLQDVYTKIKHLSKITRNGEAFLLTRDLLNRHVQERVDEVLKSAQSEAKKEPDIDHLY